MDESLFDAAPLVVEPEITPDRMANWCRQAWLEAFTTHHGRPHPAIRNRAFGQIRNLIKTCELVDDFRDVWRAATVSGNAGAWSVGDWIGPAPQRPTDPSRPVYGGNPFLAGMRTDFERTQLTAVDPAAKEIS